MPNYAKLDLNGFKNKLKNGGYDSLTGARRAIGKMQDLADEDREKARTMAERHFADGTAAPAKKAAPAKPAKRTTENREALAAKKAGTSVPGQVRVSRVKAEVSEEPVRPGPGRGRKKREEKAPRATRAPRAARETTDIEQLITTNRNAVAGITEAVDTLRKCESPGVDIGSGMRAASEALTRIIESMQTNIVEPLTSAERRGAELFMKAAPTAITPDSPVFPSNGSSFVPPPGLSTPAIPPTSDYGR